MQLEPIEFEAFPKIPRLSRECIITEKIDGTNAQVLITEAGDIYAGSRSRWLTEKDDNYGFCKWVMHHKAILLTELGPGRHYGEWWGVGIQRGYDLFERRFTLFNTARWKGVPLTVCSVVPVLYEDIFTTTAVDSVLAMLMTEGSQAAPGYKRPEGVVVFHKPSQYIFKKLLEKDSEPKGQ